MIIQKLLNDDRAARHGETTINQERTYGCSICNTFAHTYLDRFLTADTKQLTTENNSTDKTEF